jgi:hypothetical protein
MAFEPYGIGIKKKHARELGIMPVKYYRRGEHPISEECDCWLWQSRGRITDWRREQEYRHKGDFDLTGIPADRIMAFCHTGDEAASVRKKTGIRTVPFVA